VPEVARDQATDWINYLKTHPGYKPEWGTPKYGGTFKTGSMSSVVSYPETGPGHSCCITGLFFAYNSLLMFDPWLQQSAGVFCDLCETWEVSADGRVYTFKLREGIKFHSEGWGKDKGAPGFGEELVCKDVKTSMEWWAKPPKTANLAVQQNTARFFRDFDSATCPDGPLGYTVVLNFTKFRNVTTQWLATGWKTWHKEYREWLDAKYPGLQAKAEKDAWLAEMGTGPFIYTFMSADVVKSRKNPNYWRKGAPFVDGLESYPIPDYNTKFASLITGKIDLIGPGSSGATKAQVIQMQKSYPDFRLHIVQYNHISWIPMNAMLPPFDNWKVRWAVMLALDRASWDTFMTAGAIKMASPAYWLHPQATYAIHSEEFSKFPGWRQDKKDEDIAEANRLLDEVFGKGVRPTLAWYISSLLSRREIGVWGLEYLQETLGFKLEAQYLDSAAHGKLLTDCVYRIHSEAAPVHSQTYVPDPSDAFSGANSNTPWRGAPCYVRAHNEYVRGPDLDKELARIDALIDQQDAELDPVKRREMVRYLEQYMVNERTNAAVLGVMNTAWPFRPDVRGDFWMDLGSYTGQRLFDRLWFDR
jgi:ABC-type transport system substrate-binding protein